MKIFEGKDEKGDLVYFEVPNTFLSRRSAVNIIRRLHNANVLSTEYKNDIFCTFILNNRSFELLEAFGDNSRYHIGEKNIKSSSELEILKNAFKSYTPWPMSLFFR